MAKAKTTATPTTDAPAQQTASSLWDSLPTDAGAPAETVETGAPEETGADEATGADAPSTDNMGDQAGSAVVRGGQRQRSQDTIVKKKLEQEFNANPEMLERRGMWSASAKVIHGLGFSENGSYIDVTNDAIVAAVTKGVVKVVGKDDTTTECFLTVEKPNGEILGGTVREKSSGSYYGVNQKRTDGTIINKTPKAGGVGGPGEYVKKLDVPLMVGYELQNIGTQPIKAFYSECVKNSEGIWEETAPTIVDVAPGASVLLTKKTFALTASMVEYSCTFANGRASSRRKVSNPIELVEKINFIFSKENKEFTSVHNEPFKVRIDEVDASGFFRVKEAYKKVFAFLENSGKNVNKNNSNSERASMDTADVLAKMIRDNYNAGRI